MAERAWRQESSKPALPRVPDKSLDLLASRFSLSVKCTDVSHRFPESKAEGNVLDTCYGGLHQPLGLSSIKARHEGTRTHK